VFYIKKLNDETSKTSSSRCQYNADLEYVKDESNDSDSDNATKAVQYNLQDDVSPAIFWIENCKTAYIFSSEKSSSAAGNNQE
jgi:hypothetical protein